LLVLGSLQLPFAQTDESTTRDRANEKVIRDLYKRFAEAWNRHDVDALGAMWAIDGDHIEPDGTHVDGRQAVSLHLKRQHDTVFKQTHLDLSIAEVWFVADTVALVDGGYELTGVRTPDGDALPARRGHLTSLLLEEGGKWWIVASRLMIPTELPYKR
jgi:uncharacterized protein (TIGR02246 family)